MVQGETHQTNQAPHRYTTYKKTRRRRFPTDVSHIICHARTNERQWTLCPVQAYCRLANVEEDKVFGLVRHKGPEIAAHDAMPRGAVLLVKVRFDLCGNILLLLVRFQRRRSHRQRIVLGECHTRFKRVEGEEKGGEGNPGNGSRNVPSFRRGRRGRPCRTPSCCRRPRSQRLRSTLVDDSAISNAELSL